MLIPTHETSTGLYRDRGVENMAATLYRKTPATDIRQAQINMIEGQIRATGVNSTDVFDAFTAVRRENFAPEAYRDIAYADTEIPLIHNECMLTPPHRGTGPACDRNQGNRQGA